MVGHIEDIVVNKDQQGKKLGLRIIEALDFIAEKVGCYKVSLHLFCPASRATISTRSSSWAWIQLLSTHLCRHCLHTSFPHRLLPSHGRVRHPTPPRFLPTTPTLDSTFSHSTFSHPLSPGLKTPIIPSQSSQANPVVSRQFSTARKRTKASTSNAATRGSDWKWHITMINDCHVVVLEEGSFENRGSGRCGSGQASSRLQQV